MAEEVKRAAPIPRPLDKDFGLSSFKRNEWHLLLGEQFKFDDVLTGAFWANQADKILGPEKDRGRGDLIEVYQPSTGQWGRFLIVAIGTGYVKLRQIEGIAAETASEPKGSPLTTRWNPGKKGHEVIRVDDKQVMAGPFQTKDVAVAWIAEHMQKMAA